MIRIAPAEDHGLSLDVIQIDGGTQSRANVNDQVVNDYAEAIKAGATFPPIVVFYDGRKHWLADGFHRFHAYQMAGKSKVAADVRQGTRRDAILYSVGANDTHGLRRTRDDKRRAVLTLLNDAEWSKWSDREIARQCAVSPDTVGRVRKEVGPVTVRSDSEDRSYTTKHGTTATMKTAGINASRTQSQAKVSEDNGSITGGAGAVTGEASRLASGRTDAGGAASVDLPTNSDAVGDTDAIQSPFDRASDEGRALFLARNNLQEQPKVEAHDAEACNTHSNAVDPASTVTDGRANMEPDDVDRSAERASSAVEVGAPISPEGAHEKPASGLSAAHADDAKSDSDRNPVDEALVTAGETAQNSQSDDDAFSEVKGTARPENAAGVEPTSSDNPSAAHPVEAVADNPQVPRPSASAKEFPDPQYSGVATADPAHQVPKLSGAKSDVPHVVGQGCTEQVESFGYSGQEDASATQARNEPGSVSGATVTNFAAMSKADQIRLLRPHCQHPNDLEKCGGSGRNHCHACKKAMAESEAA
ncbi:ParB/RepB/Spo0J family partition protein [Aquamicrobium soli]|uniref:ParB/RepB/Spo0J family partition protein n=1 Tax=Aquamicrobium soli TaxID=1811518 RepID=A0ABV7KFH3_9HYPH